MEFGKGAQVRRHPVPVTTAAVESLGGCDHVDAVAVDLDPGTSATEFARSVMSATPEWVHGMLAVRDKLLAPFGLHSQVRVPRDQIRIKPGVKLGPFRVLSVSDDEVLTGDDDKHLDFRTSFAVREGPRGTEGVCTTVVRFHRRAGRLYFRAIQPFHNLIVPRIVARARS